MSKAYSQLHNNNSINENYETSVIVEDKVTANFQM